MEGWAALFVFMLAAFAGYEVIGRVPVILHTPLMSGSNFVHGIVLVGAMVALGEAQSTAQRAIGFIAVLLGTSNAVGGYVVTDRMLEMFKSSRDRVAGRSAPADAGEESVAAPAPSGTSARAAADSEAAGDG